MVWVAGDAVGEGGAGDAPGGVVGEGGVGGAGGVGAAGDCVVDGALWLLAQAIIQLELPEFDPKNLPDWAEEFAEFLLLTSQSHVVVATKCSLLKRSCKKKFLQKRLKQIVKNLFNLGRGTPEIGENIPSL